MINDDARLAAINRRLQALLTPSVTNRWHADEIEIAQLLHEKQLLLTRNQRTDVLTKWSDQ